MIRMLLSDKSNLLRYLYMLTPALLLCVKWAVAQQRENNMWIFGNRAGLDLNPGVATPIITGINALNGVSAVADRNTGELLFYYAENRIYDRNGNVMPDGQMLQQALSVHNVASHNIMQGSCIVPAPGHPGRYYVFTLTRNERRGGILFYSLVDMALNNGMGDVVPGQKDVLVDSGLSTGMTSVRGDRCEVWIVTHAYRDPDFRAYRVTSAGVDTRPVISRSGHAIRGESSQVGQISSGLNGYLGGHAYLISNISVSPDRSRIVIGVYNQLNANSSGQRLRGALIGYFDPGRGRVSGMSLFEKDGSCTGSVFSQDNTKLYMEFLQDGNQGWGGFQGSAKIYQYDVSAGDSQAIAASRVLLDSFYGKADYLATFRRAGDSVIIGGKNINTLQLIRNANNSGAAAGYMRNALPLPSGTSAPAIPVNDVYFLETADTLYGVALDTVVCYHDLAESGSFSMELQPDWSYDSLQWDDGGTDPTRVIDKPGIYYLRTHHYCAPRVDSFRVRHATYPVFTLGPDTVVCADTLIVRAPAEQGSYLWQDGSADPEINVTRTGTVALEITRSGCRFSDTMEVLMPRLEFDLGPDRILCAGIPFLLDYRVDLPDGTDLLWSTGTRTADVQIRDSGTVWLHAAYATCSYTDSVNVSLQMCDCYCDMPTAFSPNGDGLNDVFRPVIEPGCPVRSFVFEVYDRWGRNVFSSNRPEHGWNGTLNGAPAEVGVYMYRIAFGYGTENRTFSATGECTLVR